MRLAPLLAAILAPAICAAAGMSPDPTGLWWVPEESGWGLSLVQQQDTVVAVLFVYDDAQRPAWYVASAVGTGTHVDPPGGEIFRGTLYRTTGPWFGGAFDPRAVTATAVGTLDLAYFTAAAGKNIAVNYSVNGVSVAKTVQPQTWGSNVALLKGSYAGGFTLPALPASGCNLVSDLFRQPATFTVSDTLLPGELTMGWSTGTDTACLIHGTYVQRGRLGGLQGYLSCQPIQFPLSTDMSITLADIAASDNGFNASATIRRGTCVYVGRFGGVRQP
jgi:hypothetical protein